MAKMVADSCSILYPEDQVEASMAEAVMDIWRVQGQWPFPKWENGRVIPIRKKHIPLDISEVEEALL